MGGFQESLQRVPRNVTCLGIPAVRSQFLRRVCEVPRNLLVCPRSVSGLSATKSYRERYIRFQMCLDPFSVLHAAVFGVVSLPISEKKAGYSQKTAGKGLSQSVLKLS